MSQNCCSGKLRNFRGLLLVALFVVVGIPESNAQSFHKATAPSPNPGTIFVYPERIALQDGSMFTAYRGLMFVPMNRQKENSPVIAIEFYRFPRSENASPNHLPLFLLQGGPGFPGLEGRLAKKGFFEQNIQGYLDKTDVVVVGQRGIGSSKPDTLINLPSVPQLDRQDDNEAVAEFQAGLKVEREFWVSEGVDLSGLTVVEAATDVRDVAFGLGYEQIVISGGSFGSHWGMTLIRNHPEIVARAILHGMEGPDHTWDHPGWMWNVYKRVAEDAEKSDELKEMIPEGGLVNAIEQLAIKAEASPFPVQLGKNPSKKTEVMIDGYAMRSLARGTSSLPNWPAEVIRLHHGDFKDAAMRIKIMRNSRRSGQSTASFWTLDSASGITQKRREEFLGDAAMSVIGSTFSYYELGSPVWNSVDLGDEFRGNFKTDIPTVIVHGTWDVKTPYENAVELKPCFENVKMVTVLRGSHGAIGEAINSNKSFRDALTAFTISGDMSGFPDEVELPVPKWKVPKLEPKNDE